MISKLDINPPILNSFFFDNTSIYFIVYKDVLFFKNRLIKIKNMIKMFLDLSFQTYNI